MSRCVGWLPLCEPYLRPQESQGPERQCLAWNALWPLLVAPWDQTLQAHSHADWKLEGSC